MRQRGNIVLSILLGVLAATALGYTTDEIIRNVYDASNTALRVNLVAGGSSGTVTSTGTSPNLAAFTTATNIGNYAGTGACGGGTAITALSGAGAATCTAFGSGTVTGTGTTGLIPDWTSSTALGDSTAYRILIVNDSGTGTVTNKPVKYTTTGTAVVASAAETVGIVGLCKSGCGTTGSAVVTLVGSGSCVSDNATTQGHLVGLSQSTTGCTDLGITNTSTPTAGTTVLGTFTETGVAGTRTMFWGTPDVMGQAQGGGNKNPAGVAGNLQTRGAGNQFAVFAATDDTVPVGNGTIHVATAVPNCTDSAGNHLNYTTATNAFSCGTTGGTASLVFPVTVSGTTTSGGIPYFSSTTALTSSALLASNGIVIGGGAGGAPVTDTGLLWDVTNNRLSLVAATSATDASAFMFWPQGTLPASPSTTAYGMFLDVTSAGSAGQIQIGTESIFRAGYTGSSTTVATQSENAAVGTGNTLNFNSSSQMVGNFGALNRAQGATAGLNAGTAGEAINATGINVGEFGKATSSAAGTNIGTLGAADNSTEGTDFKNIGGYFTTGHSAGLITGSNTNVALIAQSTSTDDIFRGYNDTTNNFKVASTGAITTASTFTSSATGAIGWTPVAGANTACNTTCTSACVFGTDSVTGGILACTDATADVCLCAGSS
jgi:hypothetical protein